MKKSNTLPCGRPNHTQKESLEDNESLLASLLEKLEAFVAEKGLNYSEVRAKVLRTIIIEARHFTPQDLLDRLRKRYPEVGRATVYRTLPILVESGILQEGPTDPEGQTLYELKDHEHHDHIVCLDCHRIFEFQDETIEKRQESITKQMKFAPQRHRHVIYAHCQFVKK